MCYSAEKKLICFSTDQQGNKQYMTTLYMTSPFKPGSLKKLATFNGNMSIYVNLLIQFYLS